MFTSKINDVGGGQECPKISVYHRTLIMAKCRKFASIHRPFYGWIFRKKKRLSKLIHFSITNRFSHWFLLREI